MYKKAINFIRGKVINTFITKGFLGLGIAAILLFIAYRGYSYKSNQELEKVEMIDSLIRVGRDLAFIEKSISADLATKALIGSLEIDYKKGQADSYRLNSIVTYLEKEYLTSIEYLELAVELFKEMNDSIGLADADISYGHIYRDLNQLNKSEIYFKNAYDFFKNHQIADRLSVAEYNYANILFENGKSEMSLEILDVLNNHKKFEKNKSLYIFYLNLRAKNLIYLGLYDEALNYLLLAKKESLELRENRNKTAFIETLFYTGKVYHLLNIFDSAEYYLNYAKNDPYISDAENYSDSVFSELIYLRSVKKDVYNIKEDIEKYLEFKSSVKLKNLYEGNELKFNVLNNKHLVKDNIDLMEQQSLSNLYNKVYLFIIAVIIISFLFFLYNKRRKDQLSFVLENQKKRFVKLFENSPLSMLILNNTGDIIISNERAKAFENLFGSSVLVSLIYSVLNRVHLKNISNFEGSDSFEFESEDLFIKVYFISDNSSDQIEYTVIFEDFTALRKSTNEQKKLSELLNQSYDLAKIGSFSLEIKPNFDFDFEVISPKALIILGITMDQADYKNYNLFDLFSFENSKDSRKRILKVLNNDEFFDRIIKLRSYPSLNRWVRIVGKINVSNNIITSVTGILQDVTSEKRFLISTLENLQKEKELNFLKSKFISMTSHEFRTPISIATSSIDMIEMYSSSIDNEDIRIKLFKHSSKITKQLNKIVVLLDDILILERTSLADKTLNLEIILLDEFLQKIVEEFNSTLSGRKVQLSIFGHNYELQTDVVLFEYLINNLISNAIKFSGAGSSDILVEVEFYDKTRVIKVTDFGIGVPENEIPFIFNSFFRGSNSKSVQGSGLGLSIVNEICRKLFYDIKVESVLNQKTMFILDISETALSNDPLANIN